MNAVVLFCLMVLIAATGARLVPRGLGWLLDRRLLEAWKALASKLAPELKLPEGSWLAGEYRGRAVEIMPGLDGSVRLSMQVQAPLPAGLRLSHQGVGAGLLRLKGLRDIQVGDAQLDASVVVHADNPASTIRLLREPGVREALLALLTGHPRAVVFGSEVMVTLPLRSEPALFRGALQALERLTSVLELTANRLHAQVQEAREQARGALSPEAPSASRPAERSRAPLASEVFRDFARRKALASWICFYPLLLGLGLFVGATIDSESALLGLSRDLRIELATAGMILIFLSGTLGFVATSFFILRCPICTEQLIRHRIALAGIKACPRCQTRLAR